MASAEREPITEVWGQSPQRGPGAEQLVRGRSPPEAESILVIGCPTDPANLAVADPGFFQGGTVRQLVPLECPKPLHALSLSDP